MNATTDRSIPPIVAAVDGSAASRVAIGEAVSLASELEAPIVFVYAGLGKKQLTWKQRPVPRRRRWGR